MTKNELKVRWSDELIETTLTQLRSGEIPEPFGRTEKGLVDLRGFVIRGVLRNVSMSDVDLRYCNDELAGQFAKCILHNVDMSRSILNTNIGGAFTACKFEASNLTGAALRGSFVNCSFQEAKLKDARSVEVCFSECCFDAADLRGALLMRCTFNSCTWKGAKFGNGSFGRSKFTGEHPTDLGNTIMNRVEFD